MEYKHLKIQGNDNSTIEYHFYFGDIIPKFVLQDGVPKYITNLNPLYHLKGFNIITLNNRLFKVYVFGNHPNCNVKTGELCLKEDEKGSFVRNIDILRNIIINRLEVYYYNHCHFRLVENDCRTKPVDGFTKIDVNFDKGEIYATDPPFRLLYPE